MLELDDDTKQLAKTFFILLIVLFLLATINFIVSNLKKTDTHKKRREEYLIEIAKDYYKGYYERLAGDTKKLEALNKNGLILNLKDLLEKTKNPKTSLFFNQNTGYYCDYKKTTVTIFPVAPYKIDSYEMIVKLNCDGDY